MMDESFSYSDLVSYWECPRKLSYRKAGWRLPNPNFPILRGTYTHKGVAAKWSGEDPGAAIDEACADTLELLISSHIDDATPVQQAADDAKLFVSRYFNGKGKDIKPISVEESLYYIEGKYKLRGTPDCVGYLDGQLTVFDVKTGRDPNIRYLSHTGQADWYAYLWGVNHGELPALVSYEIISPNYITRHTRPPRVSQAQYFEEAMKNVALWDNEHLRQTPNYTYQCARCPYLPACHTLDEGGDEEEILLSKFYLEVQ